MVDDQLSVVSRYALQAIGGSSAADCATAGALSTELTDSIIEVPIHTLAFLSARIQHSEFESIAARAIICGLDARGAMVSAGLADGSSIIKVFIHAGTGRGSQSEFV